MRAPKTGSNTEPNPKATSKSGAAEAKAVALQGSVKEAIGKLIGDGRIEAEGREQRSSAEAGADAGTKSGTTSEAGRNPRAKP